LKLQLATRSHVMSSYRMHGALLPRCVHFCVMVFRYGTDFVLTETHDVYSTVFTVIHMGMSVMSAWLLELKTDDCWLCEAK
jgi:hypothetical protein